MAIVIFDRLWDGPTQEGNVFAGTRQYTEVYFVMADASTDGEPEILSDDRCPKKLSTYYRDIYAFFTNHSLRKIGPLSWNLVCTYQGASYTPGSDAVADLKTAPRMSWRTVTEEVPIDHDINGNAIANTNGEPFEGVTEEKSDALLVWTGYFTAFDPSTILNYVNSVNVGALQSLGISNPRAAKIKSIDADQEEIDGQLLWKVTVQIQFRNDVNPKDSSFVGWDKLLINKGLKAKITAEDSEAILEDANGRPRTKPVLLDQYGVETFLPANAHYLQFQTKQAKTWDEIGII